MEDQTRHQEKMKNKILLALIPLSEIKSIFYNSDKKVDWFLFSDEKRYLCNVIEDYSNIIIMGVIMYYSLFIKLDLNTKRILFFLFVINVLDFVFLGLYDNKYYLLKLPISVLFFIYGTAKVSFQRN